MVTTRDCSTSIASLSSNPQTQYLLKASLSAPRFIFYYVKASVFLTVRMYVFLYNPRVILAILQDSSNMIWKLICARINFKCVTINCLIFFLFNALMLLWCHAHHRSSFLAKKCYKILAQTVK